MKQIIIELIRYMIKATDTQKEVHKDYRALTLKEQKSFDELTYDIRDILRLDKMEKSW